MRPRWILVFSAMLLAGCASGHGPSPSPATGATTAAAQPTKPTAGLELSGKYRIEQKLPDGSYTYTEEAFVVPRGEAAYDLFWYRYRNPGFMGFGILVDDVLGTVYQSETSQTTGMGIVVYHIDGGELRGVRMMESSMNGEAGQEWLKGSPDLLGKLDIVKSVNPYGAANYEGFVTIDRSGDRYVLHWNTPNRSYSGIGLRIADKLVVGFSSDYELPGVFGYCVNEHGMTGHGARSPSGEVMHQHLQPRTSLKDASALPQC